MLFGKLVKPLAGYDVHFLTNAQNPAYAALATVLLSSA